jgi:hypothetical protein
MAQPQAPGGTVSDPSTTRPITTSGPIAKLPCELLTNVMSFVPEHIKDLRLVCHGFNDCSWPAFGARLQDTKFDMRSIHSMKNLKAISEHGELAPYVTSLCLMTGWISPTFPGAVDLIDSDYNESEDSDDPIFVEEEEYLPDELYSRLMCFRHHTKYWFAAAWDWTPCMTQRVGTTEEFEVSAQKQSVTEYLSATMSKFANLGAIQYKPDQMPQKFRDLHADIVRAKEAHGDLGIFWSINGEQRAINLIGIDILLRAIAAGDVRVKNLSIEVPAMTCHGLATYTPFAIVQKAFAPVEILRVDTAETNHHFTEGHLSPENEVPLTSDHLPNLKCLEWNGWFPFAEENPLHWKPLQDWMRHKAPSGSCPPLRHLNLLSVWTPHVWGERTFDDGFFAFLTKLGGTLKTLSLTIHRRLHWHQLINFLATSPDLSLDVLNLTLHCYSSEENLDISLQGREIPSKELVFQSAHTVTIKPDRFEAWLEKRWNPPKKRVIAKAKKGKKQRGR